MLGTGTKILVTGAGGFLGSKLVPRLVLKGHHVRTFGRSSAVPKSLQALPVEHVSGDIVDFEAVARAVKGCQLVFHLAGLVSYRRSDLKRQHEVNVVGTENVMRAALSSRVLRVIHTSSIAGMGIPESGKVGSEEMEYNLSGLGLNYCDSKHEAELVVMNYSRQGLPVLILSPGIIFGEGDTHPHHRAIFMSMSKGWLLGWPSGGVTFCDIEDVVAAHVNAMHRGRPGERYVLGSANLTYREAALTLSRVIGSRPPRFEIPRGVLEFLGAALEKICPLLGREAPLTKQVAWLSQKNIFFSADKAIAELGMPVTPFVETVRRTAPYYLGLNGGKATIHV